MDVGLVTMMFEAIALGEAIDGADTPPPSRLTPAPPRRRSSTSAAGARRLPRPSDKRSTVRFSWSTRTKPSLRARPARTKAARASGRAPRRQRGSCCSRSSSPSPPAPAPYLVNHESRSNDHADEAQATARVFLPEYQKALDGLSAMKKRGRAYVYHFDTNIPLPDLKVLAFSARTAEIGAISEAQTKLRAVWPPGATASASGAALQTAMEEQPRAEAPRGRRPDVRQRRRRGAAQAGGPSRAGILHGVPSPTAVSLRPPSHRVSRTAIRYWRVRALIGWLALAAAQIVWLALSTDGHRGLHAAALAVTALVGLAHVVVMPQWRYNVHRWEVAPQAVYTRAGWLHQESRIAPISRIQTVDSERGPLEQLFGLADVTVTTASAAGPLTIEGLDRATAERLVDELTTAAQATRGDAT